MLPGSGSFALLIDASLEDFKLLHFQHDFGVQLLMRNSLPIHLRFVCWTEAIQQEYRTGFVGVRAYACPLF